MARRRKRSDAGYGYLILGVLLLAALGWLIDFVKSNQDAILIIVIIIGAVILVVSRVQRAQRRRAEADEARRALEAKQAGSRLVASTYSPATATSISSTKSWGGRSGSA